MAESKKNISKIICLLGLASLAIYALVTKASFRFELDGDTASRPIVYVLSLFALAFVVYFVACYVILRNGPSRGVPAADGNSAQPKYSRCPLAAIIFFGVLFRVLLIFSMPIQEVDIYRYIWDGLTICEGVDPYQYSPAVVQQDVSLTVETPPNQPNWTDTQSRAGFDSLTRLAIENAGIQSVLNNVHFSEFTTPYPPVSQFVFATAVGAVPRQSSQWTFLIATKTAIVLFDLATVLLVVMLLKKAGLPLTWVVVYCWCPLLMKEFANSGHLDSIAAFWCTLAMLATIHGLWPDADSTKKRSVISAPEGRSYLWLLVASAALALGVGAKLYPIVLVPLWACICLKRGHLRGFLAIVVFVFLTAFVCWPMVRYTTAARDYYSSVVPTFLQTTITLPQKKTFAPQPTHPPGIEGFLQSWEMNDLLFMIVVENLKPPNVDGKFRPWFSVLDNDVRKWASDLVEKWSGQPRTAFWITRRITLFVLAAIVLWSCFSLWRKSEPIHFLNLAFLTLAWFWLLAPTQNPWYWSWALPFVVFARSRVWLLAAAITLIYYLRFYFTYHIGPVDGPVFFDFLFPWIEFGPFFLVLFADWCWRRFGNIIDRPCPKSPY